MNSIQLFNTESGWQICTQNYVLSLCNMIYLHNCSDIDSLEWRVSGTENVLKMNHKPKRTAWGTRGLFKAMLF